MQVEIEIRREGQAPRRVLLGQGITHIGRAPDNDLVLPDVGVSRRHARLVVHEGRAVLEDLGSGNGTFLRGERLRRHTLADLDEVVIDPFVLFFRVKAEPRPNQAPPRVTEEDETALVDQVPVELQQAMAPRQALLVVLSGRGLAASYPLGTGALTMGRSEERDIVLQDPASSRMQADLRSQDGVYWLRDFGSANGTFVNGRRVRERPLQHGDRIRVGTTEFRFELQDVDQPAAMAPATPQAPRPAQPRAASDTIPVAAASTPAAPRRGGNTGVVVGVVVGLVLLGLAVGATGLGYVGWRVWSSRQEQALAAASQADAASAQGTADRLEAAEMGSTPIPQAQPETPVADAAEPQAPDAQPTEPTTSAAPAPAMTTADAVADAEPADGAHALMDRGQQLFREGQYLEATALFYKALKREPANLEAERMCYVSCEFLALEQLRLDIEQRLVPPEERQRLYEEAVTLARRAIRGRADLNEAERALMAALEWYEADPTLVGLQQGIQARRARLATRSGSRASSRSSGNGGSRRNTAGDQRLARQYLDEGLKAIENGRFVVARDRLSRAVGLDAKLSSARSNLADVNRVLEDRAQNAWNQGRALEAQGDKEGAIAAYQQVVTYASSSQAALESQAQQRISALGS